MKINLTRRYFGETYTIGSLYVNGEYLCDTLEDKYRDLSKESKVYGETAIPFGTYQVILPVSPRFGRELPRLVDVPHFEGILIHRGNSDKDSSGCILVGENTVKGKVLNSTPYEKKIVSLIKAALNDNESVSIEITKK